MFSLFITFPIILKNNKLLINNNIYKISSREKIQSTKYIHNFTLIDSRQYINDNLEIITKINYENDIYCKIWNDSTIYQNIIEFPSNLTFCRVNYYTISFYNLAFNKIFEIHPIILSNDFITCVKYIENINTLMIITFFNQIYFYKVYTNKLVSIGNIIDNNENNYFPLYAKSISYLQTGNIYTILIDYQQDSPLLVMLSSNFQLIKFKILNEFKFISKPRTFHLLDQWIICFHSPSVYMLNFQTDELKISNLSEIISNDSILHCDTKQCFLYTNKKWKCIESIQ